MIKCSICSYQCDNWYVSNWRLACHFTFVSHLLRNFTGPCGLVFVCFVGLCCVLVGVGLLSVWDGLVKILHSISFSSFRVSSS